MRANGISTSSTTARSTACRANSMSPSTAPARLPCWRTPTTSAFRPSSVNDGFGLDPGVWFKLCLGGITGHRDFARDTGVLVRPKDACMVADAVVRVFVERGDRTDRTKARLKYVLDARRHRKIRRPGRGKTRPQVRSRCGRRGGAASGVRPHGAYRRSCATAKRAELDRRCRPGRPHVGCANARPCRHRRRTR